MTTTTALYVKCAVPDCRNAAYRSRLCSTHRTREQRGLPLDTPVLSRSEVGKLAAAAYNATRSKGGTVRSATWLQRLQRGQCAYDGCDLTLAEHPRCGQLEGQASTGTARYVGGCGVLVGPGHAVEAVGADGLCASCQRARDERRRDRVTVRPMVTIALGQEDET